MWKVSISAAAILATGVHLCDASLENPQVLPTPPMGFNNWARFECNLNETLFTETADAMVSNGLRDAGYDRLNLDDCWPADTRLPDGSLTWNTTKFPHGLPWLGKYLKARGFHFGIYEDAGNATCGGYPGTLGHEEQDAATFASWGVDYLKLDGCNVYPTDGRTMEEEYKAIYGLWHTIFSKMTKPLAFSESAPAYFSGEDNLTDWYTVMDWVPIYGELARHSDDIIVYDDQGNAWDSIMVNYNYNTLLARYQVPGYHNDPDFLIPDHPGLSMDEKKSHFALWASFSAPLIISAYIPGLPSEVVSYLKNKDLIAVNQDALSQQATLVSRDDTFDVLTRSLANGDRLLTVLNRGNSTASATVSVERLGLSPTCSYTARNLWDGSSATVKDEVVVSNLATHATEVYRLSLPKQCSTVVPTGMIFNTASTNCLTATSDHNIGFETCQGTDSQVWHVNPAGTISPLSASTACLTASGAQITLARCSNSPNQQWEYIVTGNLQSKNSKICLTESATGGNTCGFELNSQVWALPSGVQVQDRTIEA